MIQQTDTGSASTSRVANDRQDISSSNVDCMLAMDINYREPSLLPVKLLPAGTSAAIFSDENMPFEEFCEVAPAA